MFILKRLIRLNNKLTDQPEWIKDDTGKITGYKTTAGADTVFPFSESGYSMSTAVSIRAYYTTGNSVVRLPLKGIKKISFNWAKDWYCYAYAVLEKKDGSTLTILNANSLGNTSSSITKDFAGEEYDYIRFSNGLGGQSGGLFTVSNFVAS